MRAFTVHQPYAYAIVAGLKQYETRTRRTNIRGRVAVHAGKKRLNANGLFKFLNREINYGKTLEKKYDKEIETLNRVIGLVYGAVVGTVEIVGCLPVEEVVDTLTERERALGDYSAGRWAWVLKNPVMFDTPIPARGKQGWWNWKGYEHCRECICLSCDLFGKDGCLEEANCCITKCDHESHTRACPWHTNEREG